MYYDIIKTIHLVSVISWMVGLLYLPRLFVYHYDTKYESQMDKTFLTMECRLLKIIMKPAMVFQHLEKYLGEEDSNSSENLINYLVNKTKFNIISIDNYSSGSKKNHILNKNGVSDFISYKILETIKERTIGAYGGKPARIESKKTYQIDYHIVDKKLEKHKELLGWRVYATNAKEEKLNTIQAVECYRSEYKIEHTFNKLLNKITALVPIYLQKENRVKGLIRLLLLALKFESIIQNQARKTLDGKEIKGVYPGNPNRVTKNPTTKLLLYPFREISLIFLKNEQGKVFTQLLPLNNVQESIISLLGANENIYNDLISTFNSEIVET